MTARHEPFNELRAERLGRVGALCYLTELLDGGSGPVLSRGSIRTDTKMQAAAAESIMNNLSKPQREWIHAIRGTEEAMTEKVTM